MSSLKLIASAKVNGTLPVYKYKSELTGLTVVLAKVEGPVVNGYFTLATETHDDDGLPHTLEHLIFLGSELYPYKGVLDLLANRCLSSGTNAWTDTDHTCYTMTTAGKNGFLDLLPIYLDHVLYPTLSDSGFITEVHHVTEDGEDAGVVYCEIQGRENTSESLIHLQLIRAAYPNCGYSSETGGVMHNFRTSTTNTKVRDYHAEFYRPENLTVIIAGQVDIEEIIQKLEPLEAKILSKENKSEFLRPWQTPVEPLEASQYLKIFYPADEEDSGLVNVGWRGPACTTENIKLTACSVLLRYLSDTSVCPLQREFVEVPDPFASSISFNITENLVSLLYLSFENVPVDKVELVFPKLQIILQNIADGVEKIDMQRMNNILERNILEYLSNLESSPHDAVAFLVIGDVLYGNTVEDFEMRLNVNKQLEFLQTVEETYWIDLLIEFLIEGKNIVVRAVPSIEQQHKITHEENERIEKQRIDLGPEGLHTKGIELANAMTTNNIPPPNEMLTHLPIPNTNGIQFHPVTIHRTNQNNSLIGFDLNMLPVFAEAYDVHTNFVYMILTLNTDPIKPELRSYLLLLLELLTESPIRRGDTLIPYEEVVAALEKDTISIGTRLGLESNSQFSCGPFSHTASLMLQVETKKYNKGIEWISDLIHNTEFAVDRIRVCAAKMSNAVSKAKRKGNSIVRNLLKAMYYSKDSNVQVSSILHQYKFLNAILKRLEDPDTANSVVAELNELRNTITQNQNMAVHIAADWQKMATMEIDLNEPWLKIARPNSAPCREQLKTLSDWNFMKSIENESMQGTIVGLGCIDSSFLYHAAPSITCFMDPDLPVLMLFLQYLTQLEGPLWRQIRGQGFAYGYNLAPQPNEGLLYFTLYRSTNAVGAFKETQKIIEAQLAPNAVWEPTLLESAKSSLIFEIIEREKSVGDLVVQSLLSSFKNVPTDYNHILVQKVNEVSIEDLLHVGEIYVSKLFSSEAKTAIVCHPDKTSDIAAAFLQLGRELVVETSLENTILGRC